MKKVNPTTLRIGNLVDVVNRSAKVHLPTGIILRVIAVGLFEVQCLLNDIKTHEATSDMIMTIPLSDIYPITLTTDLIKRFGFHEKENGLWSPPDCWHEFELFHNGDKATREHYNVDFIRLSLQSGNMLEQ